MGFSGTSSKELVMRKMFAGLAVAAFVLALGAPAFAKDVTVKGQIIDQACYKMDKSNTGGLAAEKNAKLIAHISHIVEVTGDVTEKDGKMSIAADNLKMISKAPS